LRVQDSTCKIYTGALGTLTRRLITNAETERRLGISPATRKRRERDDPDFPKSIPVGPRGRRKSESDVEAYIGILKARASGNGASE
jgi:predicted DNA-binding transcriptional regulator AlpA